MAENYYLDNSDLTFHLHNVGLEEVVAYREDDYRSAPEFPEAPESYEDALDSYDKVLLMVGEICGELIAPRAESVDLIGASFDNGTVEYAPGTRENLKNLRQAALSGVMIPRRYGGLNMPVTIYTMMTEMVSRADASLQNLFGLQDIAETIYRFGSEDQRLRYLPRFAAGEVDGAMALTEPEAGSDLQAVQLKAHFDTAANTWILNGMKRFITNGCAQVLLVLARSEEGSRDGRGLSMFLCEKCPQLIVRRIEDKLGIHGSPTCELQFNNVPAELVGQRRRGLTRYVMSLMNGARVAISAQAMGIAEAAYRAAREYARSREQFGKIIDTMPPVYEILTGTRVQIAAARALLYETTKYVDLRDNHEEMLQHADAKDLPKDARALARTYTRLASELTPLTKAYCTEMANRVAYDGIQIHGGTGFMRDFPAERYFRDARITNIYEGTTQLQYVAAIGGVMQRLLAPIMAEIRNLPLSSKLRRLAQAVEAALAKLDEAVQTMGEQDDTEYHDLMAGRLCRMESAVFISHLLIRDAHLDKRREPLAERYVLDSLPSVNLEYEIIQRGDFSLIDGHREILEL